MTIFTIKLISIIWDQPALADLLFINYHPPIKFPIKIQDQNLKRKMILQRMFSRISILMGRVVTEQYQHLN